MPILIPVFFPISGLDWIPAGAIRFAATRHRGDIKTAGAERDETG